MFTNSCSNESSSPYWQNFIKTGIVFAAITALVVAILGGVSLYDKAQLIPRPGNWIMTITGSTAFVGLIIGLVCQKKEKIEETSASKRESDSTSSDAPLFMSPVVTDEEVDHLETPPASSVSASNIDTNATPITPLGSGTPLSTFREKEVDHLETLPSSSGSASRVDSNTTSTTLLGSGTPVSTFREKEVDHLEAPSSSSGSTSNSDSNATSSSPLVSAVPVPIASEKEVKVGLLPFTPEGIETFFVDEQINPTLVPQGPLSDEILMRFLIRFGVIEETERKENGIFQFEPTVMTNEGNREENAAKKLQSIEEWELAEFKAKLPFFPKEQTDAYALYINTAVYRGSDFPICDVAYKESRRQGTGQEFFMNAVGLFFGTGANLIFAAAPKFRDNKHPDTCSDFWQLIWETEAIVVNLTDFNEGGNLKCPQYFPHCKRQSEKMEFGPFTVERKEFINDYARVSYNLSLAKESETKNVTLFHVNTWQDHGKFDITSAFDLIHTIQTEHQQQKRVPVLVHCSGGVGRSGTFAAMYMIHTMMQYAHVNKTSYHIDFDKLVRLMRMPPFGRLSAVQTGEQLLMLEDFANRCELYKPDVNH